MTKKPEPSMMTAEEMWDHPWLVEFRKMSEIMGKTKFVETGEGILRRRRPHTAMPEDAEERLLAAFGGLPHWRQLFSWVICAAENGEKAEADPEIRHLLGHIAASISMLQRLEVGSAELRLQDIITGAAMAGFVLASSSSDIAAKHLHEPHWKRGRKARADARRGGEATRRVDHETRCRAIRDYLERHPAASVSEACRWLGNNNNRHWTAEALQKSWTREVKNLGQR